jgi:hypothetical protein
VLSRGSLLVYSIVVMIEEDYISQATGPNPWQVNERALEYEIAGEGWRRVNGVVNLQWYVYFCFNFILFYFYFYFNLIIMATSRTKEK